MKENDIPLKKPYLPPKLVTVAFKVEDSFTSRPYEVLLPWSSSSDGLTGYRNSANENSFFDADLPTSNNTSPYGNFTWEW